MNKNLQKAEQGKLRFLNLIDSETEYEITENFNYKNNTTKVEMFHIECGQKFNITPKNFKHGRRCPNSVCLQKRKQKNCLEKYGVLHHMHVEDIKEKIKNTNLEKYGCKFPLQSDSVQKKMRATMIKRYGAPYTAQSKILQQKLREVTFWKRIESFQRENNIILLTAPDPDLPIRSQKGQFQCKNCNNIFERGINSTTQECHSIECRVCTPLDRSSKGEKALQDFISQYLKTECNKKFYFNGKLRYELDVYIPDLKIGFEFDGIYWHSEFSSGKPKNYHLEKQKFFQKKGIEVFFIRENEWSTKQEIIESYIKSKLNIIERKFFARNTTVKQVDHKTSSKFLSENHLQGNVYAHHNQGLFTTHGELICLLTLGKPRYNKKYDFEIYRFCSKLNCSIVGGFSKLFKFFIRSQIQKPSVVSYSNQRLFNGRLYQMNGFHLQRITQPNYMYTKDFRNLFPREKFQKHKLSNVLENFDPKISEIENMINHGYDRIWDCGNKVFVWETS